MSTYNYQKITLRYLIALYGEDKALKLFKVSESKLFDFHGLAWALGKQNFSFFCEVFLHDLLFDYSGDCVPLSETHYKIWLEIQDTILNRNDTRNCYVFPRSFGKSTTITVPLALWCALYCIHPFTVIDSATDAQSQNFIATIKKCIEGNQLIESCFGKVINKDLKYNASEIELDVKPQRSKIQSVSSTSSVRGINYGSFRIGLLILDDAQDEKQITTEQSAAALVNRIQNGVLKALQNKNNHVVALGTIQRKGDLYDTFVHSPAWFTRTEKCVRLDDIDAYFKESAHWQKVREILNGKSQNVNALYDAEAYYTEHKAEMDFPLIWQNYDCFNLAKEYFENPVSFKKERQCDINTLGMKRITSMSKIDGDVMESLPFGKTILSVDPASTTNRKSDYTAFCVLSENTENKLKYARKIIIKRFDGDLGFNDYIGMIITLLKAYTDIQLVSIEKQVYSGADVNKLRELIARDSELKNRPLQIVNKQRTKNKDNRINAVIPDINSGRIIFNEDDADALEQIADFAGCAYTAHDDAIDALTDSVEYLSLIQDEEIPKIRLFTFADFGL